LVYSFNLKVIQIAIQIRNSTVEYILDSLALVLFCLI
jgi:hypothetical protein